LIGAALIACGGCGHHRKFVAGSSCMSPTISRGEIMITAPFRWKRDAIRRYDIIVFHSPVIPQAKWVMRVIALPGERVAVTTNALFINGAEVPEAALPAVFRHKRWLTPQLAQSELPRQWSLGSNQVFAVGDNLENSNDSRYWGPLDTSAIVGVVEKVRPRRGVRITFDQVCL
jgi:signal peptidase I